MRRPRDGGARKDTLHGLALDPADAWMAGRDAEEGAVAEGELGRTLIDDFEAGEVAEALDQLHEFEKAFGTRAGEDELSGELDLLLDQAADDAFDDGGILGLDSGEEGVGHFGVELGEHPLAAGSEAEHVAGPAGAVAKADERDQAQRFEAKQVLANGAGGEERFASKLFRRSLTIALDRDEKRLAGLAQKFQTSA